MKKLKFNKNSIVNKKNSGITLVALVVTIIVLIILAGISISLVLGDNGIITKAKDAKTFTERARVVEQARTDVLGFQAENKGRDLDKTQLKSVLDTYFKDVPDLTDRSDTEIIGKKLETLSKYGTHTIAVSEIYNGNLKGEAPQVAGNLNSNEISGLPSGVVEIAKNDVTNTTIKNNDNIRAVITGEVPIPNGFYYVGGTKDDGVVISDNIADSGKGTNHQDAITLTGNQFVWVPVETASEFIKYEGYENGSKQSKVSDCLEPSTSGYSTEIQEYNAMKTSVENNKGFFVARYEASSNNGTVESKQGKTVWTNIKWGNSMSSIGTVGAVYKSQQMYKDSESVTSTLIYGVQWDAIMAWIDPAYKTGNCEANSFVRDSTGKGHYGYSNKATTGSKSDYAVKNIYDLGGNVYEWTMESCNSESRVYRRRLLWCLWSS